MLLAATLVAGSCHWQTPQLVVVVDTDMEQLQSGAGLPPLTSVILEVRGGVDGAVVDMREQRLRAGSLLPQTFGVVSAPGRQGQPVDVRVTAVSNGVPLWTTRAITPVPTTGVTELVLFLADRCRALAATCMPNETCGLSGCMDPTRPVLAPYTPGDLTSRPWTDAGREAAPLVDATSEDAVIPTETGPGDVSVPDATFDAPVDASPRDAPALEASLDAPADSLAMDATGSDTFLDVRSGRPDVTTCVYDASGTCFPTPLPFWFWRGNGSFANAGHPDGGAPLAMLTAGTGYVPFFAPGYTCNAFGFDATGYLQGPAPAALGSGDLSVDFWFNWDGRTTPGDQPLLFAFGNIGTAGQAFVVAIDPSDRLVFSNWGESLPAPTPLVALRWYHVAVTLSGLTVTLYLDGSQVASSSGWVMGLAPNRAMPLTLGGVANPAFQPTRWFRGRIQDVGLYDSVLASNAVRNLHLATPTERCF